MSRDGTAPVITLNGDNPQVIELGSGYTELGATTDDGSAVSIDDSAFVDAVGSYEIVYSSVDSNDNAAEDVIRTVTVEDTVPPTASCQEVTVQLNGSGVGVLTVAQIDNGSSDSESGVTLSFSEFSIVTELNFDCTDIGSQEVTLFVTDDSGNVAQCSAELTIVDDLAPEFVTFPQNENIESGQSVDLTGEIIAPTATDNCTADQDIQIGFTRSDGGTDFVFDSGTVVTIAWTATDVQSNVISQNQTITVSAPNDTMAPVITLLGDAELVVSQGDTYEDAGATAEDEVDGDLSAEIQVGGDTVDTSLVGTYVVTYNVSDAADNPAEEVIRTVFVEDNTPPVITLVGANPQEIEVGAGYTELGAQTDDGSEVSIDISDFVDAVGSYEIRYNSIDENNNLAQTVTRTVNVNAVATALVSDDFCTGVLGSQWTFVDPNGDGGQSFSGPNTRNATVDISVPGGVDRQLFRDGIQAPHLLQSAPNGDFEIEVKMDSPVNAPEFQEQGILVKQDDFNFIRFEVYSTASRTAILSGVLSPSNNDQSLPLRFSQIDNDNNINPLDTAPIYMRVKREGNTWTQSYSFDGINYTVRESFVHDLTVTGVGIYGASGSDETSPAHTAKFDYFQVLSEDGPIADEDGCAPSDTVPPTITLIGDNPLELVQGDTYEEFGANAEDDVDGIISDNIVINSEAVDTNIAGTYEVTYNVMDAAENPAEEVTRTVNVSLPPTGGPVVDIYYGDTQEFGNIGVPQRWCNILGHISDNGSIETFEYTLNGGTPVALSIGPDNRRLHNVGDFNIDIDFSDFLPGLNTVEITAVDNELNVTTKEVTINYTENTVWPNPYDLDWSDLGNDITRINEFSHVVDGNWELTPDGIRTAEPGYDRLIAIGDQTWDNYEVLVPFTINEIIRPGFGIGVLLRWQGHTDTPITCPQPKCGFLPLGNISWYRRDRLEYFEGVNEDQQVGNQTPRDLELNVTYMMRTSVNTDPNTGNTVYQMKVWEQGTQEPATWDLEQTSDSTDLQQGSFMLLAHQADVTFGNVSVTPGSLAINSPKVTLANNNTEATVTWGTNQPATSRIDYGTTLAYGSSEESLELTTNHSVTITGLVPGTVYNYNLSGQNAASENAETGKSNFYHLYGGYYIG